MWDALIEYQSSFVRAGTAAGFPWASPETTDHERILRALASEPRLARRQLAKDFRFALSKSESGGKFARIALSGSKISRAYVFLTAPKPPDVDYQTYREMRSTALLTYCHGIKVRFPRVIEAVGIASEPYSESAASQDFLYVDLRADLTREESAQWSKAMEELDVLQATNKEVQLWGRTNHEFPIAFNFGGPKFFNSDSGAPMNRAERRKMAREAQREAQKSSKRRP